MHGKLVHVETSLLHLLKLEWQGDTRPATKVFHCTKLTNSMDLEKLTVSQLVKKFHALNGTPI